MKHKEMALQEPRLPVGRGVFGSGISEMFEELFRDFPALRLTPAIATWTPKVNIRETDKEYVITAALPGVKKDEVAVKVQNGMLVISGEHKEEKEEKSKGWLRQEMSYGSFQRSFLLPAGVHPENVKATHKDGILTVSLPKSEQERSRGVDIKVD